MNTLYNYKRAHKANLYITFLVLLFFIAKSILSLGFEDSLINCLFGLVAACIPTLVYFLPINDLIKGLCFGLFPTLTVFVGFFMNGFTLEKHYILFLAVTAVVLYFNSKLLIIYDICVNVLFVLTYIMSPTSIVFTVDSSTLNAFLGALLMLNGAMALLIFSTIWGNSLMNSAIENDKKTKSVLNQLKSTYQQIEQLTSTLSHNMGSISKNAFSTKEASTQLTSAMNEIATGTTDQASSINQINQDATDIGHDVQITNNISTELSTFTSQMIQNVEIGELKIVDMNEKMKTIDTAISTAIIAVQELVYKMDDINKFLEVIGEISSQTELLSLNAAIESARAGEAGRGFAIVSEEIKKLSEQSYASVNDIRNIVTDISAKTKETMDVVSHGNTAVSEGTKTIQDVISQYSEIKTAFSKSVIETNKEIDMIKRVTNKFLIIRENIESIASITEEQSASTEEILASIENQNANTESISNAIQKIEAIIQELSTLVNQA